VPFADQSLPPHIFAKVIRHEGSVSAHADFASLAVEINGDDFFAWSGDYVHLRSINPSDWPPPWAVTSRPFERVSRFGDAQAHDVAFAVIDRRLRIDDDAFGIADRSRFSIGLYINDSRLVFSSRRDKR
jgi:hypothetical protein